MERYVSSFIDYMRYERNYSAHTVTSYTNDLSQFLGFLDEKKTTEGDVFEIDNVDADVVRQWMMTLMKQPLSPTSVNRKLSALQSFFTYAVRMGFVQKHPLRFVNGPKKPKPLPYFIKEKDINGLLDAGTADKGMAYRGAAGTISRVTKSHAPRTGMTDRGLGTNSGTGTTDRGLGMNSGTGTMDRDLGVNSDTGTTDSMNSGTGTMDRGLGANSDVSSDGGDCRFEAVRDLLMLEMLYATGIRCSELVGIKDRDVDMEAMLIKVTGKRNKQRLIPFAQQLKDVIYNYYNVRAKEVGEGCASFFTRKDGRAVTSAIVYYVIKKQLSGIPTLAKRSPHVLRHTFATNMLNNGATLSGVSRLLGHSSLASTSVYTHVTFEELKKVYNAHPRAKI